MVGQRNDEAARRDRQSHVIQALRTTHPSLFAQLPAPCRLHFVDEQLEIDGEVPSLAIKRRAVRWVAAHPDVGPVVDRLRVTCPRRMSDAAIADHAADALCEEATLADCAVRTRVQASTALMQQPTPARGDICVTVEDGVVILTGQVPALAQKRLTGVVTWWIPGVRDVVDQLGVLSLEVDDDDTLAAFVRAALDKDPLLDASQIRVVSRACAVTLSGLVWSATERHSAENDAWSVFGVVDVENRLVVAESPE